MTGTVAHPFLRVTNWDQDFEGTERETNNTYFDDRLVPFGLRVYDNNTANISWPDPSVDEVWIHMEFIAASPDTNQNDDSQATLIEFISRPELGSGAARTVGVFGHDGTGESITVFADNSDTSSKVFILDRNDKTWQPKTLDFHFFFDSVTNDYVFELYAGGQATPTLQRLVQNSSGTNLMPNSMAVSPKGLQSFGDGSENKKVIFSELIVSEQDTRGMRLAMLNPDSTGNYDEWQGDHNELGDLEMLTLAGTQTADAFQSSVMETYGGPASSAGVQLILSAHAGRGSDSSTPQKLEQGVRIGGTDYLAGEHTLIISPQQQLAYYPENPVDGSQWSTSDISGIEAILISRA